MVNGIVALAQEFVEAFLAVLVVCPGEHDEDAIVDEHSVSVVGIVLSGSE
jgi:hypothetical protein